MNIKLLFLIPIILLISCNQKTDKKEFENDNKTEIFIVGTSHNPTNYQTSDTLYNILQEIKPDLILVELDTALLTTDYEFDTINFPDILNTCENQAIYRYRKQNNIKLRPFDINGRNDFYEKNDFFGNQSKMYSEITKLYENKQLDSVSTRNFELISSTLDLTNNIEYRNLSELNSDVSLKLTELRQKILYDLTIEIVKNTEQLIKWKEFAELQKKFWIKRNNVMFENIKNYIEKNKYNKILIFVGATHKYFLMNLFENKKNNNYIVRDIWK